MSTCSSINCRDSCPSCAALIQSNCLRLTTLADYLAQNSMLMNHPGCRCTFTDLPKNNLKQAHTSRHSGTIPAPALLPELATPRAAFLLLLPWQVDTSQLPRGTRTTFQIAGHGRDHSSHFYTTRAGTSGDDLPHLLRAVKRPGPRTAAAHLAPRRECNK